jgi:cytochrome c-type biogenesis protein CcmH
MFIVAALILALLVFARAETANAQSGGDETLPPGVTWDQVNAIARQMYCDVCEGIPLDECESAACRDWRQEIATMISQGYSEDEIINHFVARYGDEVAAVPRDTSDRWLSYIVPLILVAGIGLIGFFQVRRFRQRGQQAGQVVRRSTRLSTVRPVPDDVDAVYLARLEQELENLES